jgi:hypothetical protein
LRQTARVKKSSGEPWAGFSNKAHQPNFALNS